MKTIEMFLKRLARLEKKAVETLPKRFRENYLEREGYFADSKSSQARHRLDQCAKDLWYLIDRFRGRADVAEMEAYQTMVRLFDEQCVVVGEVRDEQGVPTVSVTEPASEETDGEADAEDAVACAKTEMVVENAHAVAEPAATNPLPTPPVAPQTESEPSDALDPAVGIALKNAKDVASDSLQSPSDTDATYSGHKGKGYQAQRAETCHPDNPFPVIDYVQVEGAHESDMNAPAAWRPKPRSPTPATSAARTSSRPATTAFNCSAPCRERNRRAKPCRWPRSNSATTGEPSTLAPPATRRSARSRREPKAPSSPISIAPTATPVPWPRPVQPKPRAERGGSASAAKTSPSPNGDASKKPPNSKKPTKAAPAKKPPTPD